MKTRVIKQREILPINYLLDAKGQILGKLSVKVAKLLLGKNRVNAVKYIPISDKIVIKNASLVEIDPMRYEKTYKRHSMYPGGFKETTILTMREKHPERLIMLSIKGMLPKNRLGRKISESIQIFKDERVPELKYKNVD